MSLFEELADIVRPAACPVLSPAQKLLDEIHWLIHDAAYAFRIGNNEEGHALLAKADKLAHDQDGIIK